VNRLQKYSHRRRVPAHREAGNASQMITPKYLPLSAVVPREEVVSAGQRREASTSSRRIESQEPSSRRPATIQTDLVQVQSPLDHIRPEEEEMAPLRKRPHVPKLKLRSRTPVSLHAKDPKQGIEDRPLHIIAPSPKEPSPRAAQQRIMSQLNGTKQPVLSAAPFSEP
jgi:hypothetical protein